MRDDLLQSIRTWLPDALEVRGLERLTGGANNETWSFDVATAAGVVPLVLRRAAGSGRTAGGAPSVPAGAPNRDLDPRFDTAPDPQAAAIGLATEARVIERVFAAGVPVPRVRAVLTPADALGEAFVMDRLAGEALPRRLLRDPAFANARRCLPGQCGAALARLHTMPITGLPPLRRSPAGDELELWARRWRAHDSARPVMELALRWLRDRLPAAPDPLSLIHGDCRNGNVLADPQGLVALLDWELAHLGDPMEDLGWFCVTSWRFGELDADAGGFGPREALFEGYRSAGGAVDADRVRYWEVLGTFKWGVMCLDMAAAWRSGCDRSVERVAVGRRASEVELDLLRLIAPRR